MNRQPEETTRGFRPNSRRRNRIAAGVALGAAAIGGNLLVYSSLNDTTAVVQAVRDIPAGSQITLDMFRVVDVDIDPTVPTIGGAQLSLLTGQYARTRIASGSLVVGVAIQPDPLVEAGKAILAIEIDKDLVPTGVRARSSLEIVTFTNNNVASEPVVAEAIPARAMSTATDSASGGGTVSLSIEVDATQAVQVATADVVRVVLLPPGPDAATDAAPEEGGR
ncbi:MAG: hypothetical protein ACJAXA_001398 [Candidatus Aldehydirespiratoraceae bacterium]|jgi:hypothetical protein